MIRSKSILVLPVVAFAVCTISTSFATITPSFQGLGDLPGGGFWSDAYAVSADGSVVVGRSASASGSEAFRWENGEMVALGDLPGGDYSSYARGLSADGSVVVGYGQSNSGQEAFRWENGEMVGLGDLPGDTGSWGSWAFGVSADGSVVIGGGHGGWEASYWTSGDGMVSLGDLPGGDFWSLAHGVSADGSVVVGYGDSTSGRQAFRWENGEIVGLGDLPGGSFFSGAHAVSADGSVVVGFGSSSMGTPGWSREAFRWENGEMVGLGDLPGGDFRSYAYGVSADGSVIVGEGRTTGESGSLTEAFIWDEENGTQNLQDILINDYGLDLTGWTLVKAWGVSADGQTIVGWGYGPDGPQGWIATIPEPSTLLLLGLGGLALRRCSGQALRRKLRAK